MRKQRGFTLIELLIVVAIIGIIAAIAIPNLLNAINRGRQKRTMADMRSIATAIETYSVDYGFYPKGIAQISDFTTYLTPTYIRTIPQRDAWKTTFKAQTSANGQTYSLVSYGKDGSDDGISIGLTTTDFNADIGFSNGSFVQWPEGVQNG